MEVDNLCESAATEGEDVGRRLADSQRLLAIGRQECPLLTCQSRCFQAKG